MRNDGQDSMGTAMESAVARELEREGSLYTISRSRGRRSGELNRLFD